MAVPRYQQHRVKQPGQPLVTVPADTDYPAGVHQDERSRYPPRLLEEIIERVLSRRQQQRAGIRPHEAGGDPVGIHVVPT